jgi:hypothetical protein
MNHDNSNEPPTGHGWADREPMTGAQRSVLETILRGTGQPVPERLTAAEAAQLIARLRADRSGGSDVR